jgi:hypothetical protein
MLIRAKYDGHEVLLNTNYIVDVWDINKPIVSAYVLDDQRGEYKVEQSELQKWIKYENEPQEVRLLEDGL